MLRRLFTAPADRFRAAEIETVDLPAARSSSTRRSSSWVRVYICFQPWPPRTGKSSKSFQGMTKFVGFAVGAALARYDLAATEKEGAEQEALQYLEQHHVIEVWSDHRRVARTVRK
jgi:hypothetical protein